MKNISENKLQKILYQRGRLHLMLWSTNSWCTLSDEIVFWNLYSFVERFLFLLAWIVSILYLMNSWHIATVLDIKVIFFYFMYFYRIKILNSYSIWTANQWRNVKFSDKSMFSFQIKLHVWLCLYYLSFCLPNLWNERLIWLFKKIIITPIFHTVFWLWL